MRKLSQDGGDNTSITSGIEKEIKKSGAGILKSTKNSFKRKVQSFSTESDDTANEPLLHKSKENSEIEKQSAKLLLSKTKIDFASSKGNDKDKLLGDDKIAKPSITDITGITDAFTGSGSKDLGQDMSQSSSRTAIHNHMNTNAFNNVGKLKNTVVTKSQILVEVDTSKPSGYAPSPLIFTTAKIHTDGKMHEMEPVQVTPVPILSTIESGVVKTENKVKDIEKNKETAPKSPGSRKTDFNVQEKYDSHVTSNEIIPNGSMKRFGNKNNDNKVKVSTPLFSTAAQKLDSSKITSVESTRIKTSEPSVLSHTCSAIDKIYTDVNKNVQSELKTDGRKKNEDKKVDSRVVSSQPSYSAHNIRLNLGSTTTTNVVTNTRDHKSDISQDNEIAISKVKSPDHEQVLNITKTMSTVKRTIDPASNNANSAIIAKNLTALSNNEVDSAKSPKNNNVEAESSAKSLLSTATSGEIQPLATSSLTKSSIQCTTTGIKTSSQSKPFDSKNLSNVSSVSNFSSLPTAVTLASVAPQINKVPTTTITTTNNKNSAKVMTTTTSMINSKLSSSISSTVITTADVSKLKSKNVATVVSSISKATTTTPSSTKTISPSSSSHIPKKATLSSKQLTSPSTVKTISSVPTVKSAGVGTVHHDKISTKGDSTSVIAMSTVSNNASSTSKKPLAAKGSNTVTVIPSAKVAATTTTKLATKSSTQSDIKPSEDNKGPRA